MPKRHPKVEQVLARIRGVEWHILFFDFNNQCGVSGTWPDGRRMAARFKVDHRLFRTCGYTAANIQRLMPEMIAKAKDEVIKQVALGNFVHDEVLEGREVNI